MILYHGTNVEFEQIDLSFSKVGKDFGCGFYLNPDFRQAQAMAERVADVKKNGAPRVYTYEFDEALLAQSGELKVKIFEDYSEEWANFVLMNRKNENRSLLHPYDIVVGPIANDTVGLSISLYQMDFIDMKELLRRLRYNREPAVQYYFGTECAVAQLKRITQ